MKIFLVELNDKPWTDHVAVARIRYYRGLARSYPFEANVAAGSADCGAHCCVVDRRLWVADLQVRDRRLKKHGAGRWHVHICDSLFRNGHGRRYA